MQWNIGRLRSALQIQVLHLQSTECPLAGAPYTTGRSRHSYSKTDLTLHDHSTRYCSSHGHATAILAMISPGMTTAATIVPTTTALAGAAPIDIAPAIVINHLLSKH